MCGSLGCVEVVPYTTKTSTCKVHCVDHFYLAPFTGRSSIYSEISTMSVIEIVSLACLFILFSIMFFVVKNHLVLMQLCRQRAERDGAMMDVQDRENPTLDIPLQPRVGEMAPIGMHVISHQKGVLESGGNWDSDRCTAYGCGAKYIFPSKNGKSPTSSRKR